MSKSALDGTRANIFMMDPADLVIVGIDEGDESHALYDARVKMTLPEALVESILREGVLQPVLVRKDAGKAYVLAGRQRVRAAREANKRIAKTGGEPVKIPTLVKRADDLAAMSIDVVENEIRFNDDLSTKSKKALALIDRGLTEGEVASRFGVTSATIKNWLALSELHPRVRGMVEAGALQMVAAIKELSDLPRDEQVEAAERLAAAKPTRASRKAKGEKIKKGVSPAHKVRVLREAEDKLPEAVATVLRWLCGEASDKALVAAVPSAKWALDKE